MPKEKKTKIISKVIGLILVLGSALFTVLFLFSLCKDKHDTEKIINEVFDKAEVPVHEETNQNSNNTNSENNNIVFNNKYLGYIEYSGIKRLITSGTDDKTLDKGYVGTYSTSANLDDNTGNIIIAGHNNYNVFRKLHYIKIDDKIKIVSHNNTYNYYVTEKHIVKDDDFTYFKQVKDDKILTLVTCTNSGKQRLIVIAKLRR